MAKKDDQAEAAKKVEETLEVDYNEIHEKPIEAVVAEAHEPEEPEAPKEESKEEVKEEKKEEPKTETVDEEVPFDPEEYKKQVKEEALAEAAKVIEAAGKTPDNKEDNELISPWVKENRAPTSYEEVADWALTKKDILDKRAQAEREKATHQQEEDAKKHQEEQTKAFNKFTDDQLEDLYTAGKLERGNEEQRKALFQTMLDVNIERQKNGKTPIYSIKEIFYEHYKAPEKQEVAGADAPIVGGAAPPPPENKELDYLKDVQPNIPFTQWVSRLFSKDKN